MTELFHVTGDDIRDLRDDDLRELIGMLCESDYRAAKIRTTGITWGGNQDAVDGGFDVVVRDDIQPPANSSIPRAHTGFQIKKPAMGPAEIPKEMKPNGVLRDSIKALIAQSGAYIIVSSKATTTDSAIMSRKAAMRAAVSKTVGHENLHLDFYDRGRIATWVRSHPALILWVRTKTGRPLRGWQSYDNWSMSPQGLNDDYLLDDGLRLHRGTNDGDKGEKAIDAIQYLRNKLAQPKACLRLVGLSGVGKTRFVQTLFDERVGNNSLNPSRAIYTDISDSPVPDPVTFAKRLIAERIQAVLIVDNCPPDLHKRLVHVCSGSESTISLLTVEYDVRDDLPEETNVLRLDPASEKLIEQLIQRRFQHIGQVDAQTIAEFSGGNARVAIALASTVRQGETLGRLRDAGLFKRLFDQTNNENVELLRCAEALSLLYSFEGTDTESDKSELRFLAEIIEKPVGELYRSVAELQKRQLIQSRGVWRAILPHAIANRLAEQALKSIPNNRVLKMLMVEGRERLLRSFTRRLGFLHDNVEAQQIAAEWLATNGWLGQANGNLSELGIEVLKNIAPVVPEGALALMEYWNASSSGSEFASRQNARHQDYVRILRQIAYDPQLFSRCVALICRFALAEDPNERHDSTRDTLKSLFYIHLSGTHASAEVRAKVIKNLWNSGQEAEQELALYLLDAAYEAWHFSSHHEFSFGARPRDWGWHPRTRGEIAHWYNIFITLGLDFSRSGAPKACKARKLLASNFRGMWTGAHMHKELDALCDKMLQAGAWNEGWIAVRQIIQFDNDKTKPEVMDQLRRIEEKLKPLNLLEMARTYALSDQSQIYDLDDIEEDESTAQRLSRAARTTHELGRKVAEDPRIFAELLPGLLTVQNSRLHSFGQGLAEGSPDKKLLWQNMREGYEGIPEEQIRVQCLMGILSSPSMDIVREEIMDSLVEDPILYEYYPHIQTTVPITPQALARLHRSLDFGKAPIHMYQYIVWGGSHESLSDDELAEYLQKILSKEDGISTALEIIQMRFYSSGREHSEPILELAREILTKFSYNLERNGNLNSDHALAELANKCMRSVHAEQAASELCKSLATAIGDYRVYAFDYPELLGKLAELQPTAFLDVFLSAEARENHRLHKLFLDDLERGRNPLDKIGDADLIAWCDRDPSNRYPVIASSISSFKRTSREHALEWNPLVYKLFEEAPNLSDILQAIGTDLEPMAWSGSRADIITQRAEILKELFTHKNDRIASWAKARYDSALQSAQRAREWEERHYKVRDETFE